MEWSSLGSQSLLDWARSQTDYGELAILIGGFQSIPNWTFSDPISQGGNGDPISVHRTLSLTLR